MKKTKKVINTGGVEIDKTDWKQKYNDVLNDFNLLVSEHADLEAEYDKLKKKYVVFRKHMAEQGR